MPELRSGVRRGRAAVAQKGSEQPAPPPAKRNVKTRAAAAKGRPRTRLAAKKPEREKPPVIVTSEAKAKKNKEKGVGVMGDDSGGLSANKGVAPEDNTPPFPERVCGFFESYPCFDRLYFIFLDDGWLLLLR